MSVKGHQFNLHHFYSPTMCLVCDSLIWGIGYQGLLCSGQSLQLPDDLMWLSALLCTGDVELRAGERTCCMVVVVMGGRLHHQYWWSVSFVFGSGVTLFSAALFCTEFDDGKQRWCWMVERMFTQSTFSSGVEIDSSWNVFHCNPGFLSGHLGVSYLNIGLKSVLRCI